MCHLSPHMVIAWFPLITGIRKLAFVQCELGFSNGGKHVERHHAFSALFCVHVNPSILQIQLLSLEGLSKCSVPSWFQTTYGLTVAAEFKSDFVMLCWASSSVWAVSRPCAKSCVGNTHSTLSSSCDYISWSDWKHLVVFPSSFSVVWQQPSLEWITRRTRVERTVSFMFVLVSLSVKPEETRRSPVSLMSCGWSIPGGNSLLLFNPCVFSDLISLWGHVLRSNSLTYLLNIFVKA